MVKRYWLPALGALAVAFAGLIVFFRTSRPDQASNIARDAPSAEQSRAYLTLTATHFRWDSPEVPNGGAAIELEWKNVGRTAATNIGFSHAIEFVPVGKGAKPAAIPGFILQPQPGIFSLEPGEAVNSEAGHIPAAMVKKWKAGDYSVFIYSAVVYTDFLGTENRVETCNRAIPGELGGKTVFHLKAAEFNNSSVYGIATEKA